MKKKAVETKPPDPLDEVRSYIHEQQQLRRALEVAERRVQQREQELDEARHVLAAAEAARLTADPEAEDGYSPESSGFVNASLELERARAAVGGLRRQIKDRDITLLTISEQLRAEREAYIARVLEEFRQQRYGPAATEFAKILRQAAALSDSLGVTVAEASQLPERGNWQEDPEAVKLHDAHAEPRQLGEAMEVFRKEAEVRVRAEEMDRKRRAPFDPAARFTVRKPFQTFGKGFAAGETVDASQLPLSILGKLFTAGFLLTIEKVNEWEKA